MKPRESGYLTPELKQDLLDQLCVEVQSGEVDLSVIPYLERINAVPGVVTEWSCYGHAGTQFISDRIGYLCLRVTEPFKKAVLPKLRSIIRAARKESGTDSRCSVGVLHGKEIIVQWDVQCAHIVLNHVTAAIEEVGASLVE
jgi:hypothetical protein